MGAAEHPASARSTSTASNELAPSVSSAEPRKPGWTTVGALSGPCGRRDRPHLAGELVLEDLEAVAVSHPGAGKRRGPGLREGRTESRGTPGQESEAGRSSMMDPSHPSGDEAGYDHSPLGVLTTDTTVLGFVLGYNAFVVSQLLNQVC